MKKYDTDLWTYLKRNKTLDISTRIEIAKKFMYKVRHLKSKEVSHRDLKPKNVLLNLKEDGQWDSKELEITDYGISQFGHGGNVSAGTYGFAPGYQFTSAHGNDDHNARLVIFLILLSWDAAWAFIWDGVPISKLVEEENEINSMFGRCQDFNGIMSLLTDISHRVKDITFQKQWADYCASFKKSFADIDSNTQRSVQLIEEVQERKMDGKKIDDGTKLHEQDFSNLCSAFSTMTCFRKELQRIMDGELSEFENETPLQVLDVDQGLCSFFKFIHQFIGAVSPRSMHGLDGQNWNQKEISNQLANVETGLRRLEYAT